MDNRHRKEGERKRSDIARFQYCNRLRHIASQFRILACEKRDGRSEGNRLTNINNADRRFRDKNEAPSSYRNKDGHTEGHMLLLIPSKIIEIMDPKTSETKATGKSKKKIINIQGI
jgi:hypothetical protein